MRSERAIELPELPSRGILALIAGAFFVLTITVYGASLRNDFVRLDDGLLIYENAAVREISPWSLKKIFTTYDPELYIPLTLFSYQMDYALGGRNPFVYHFHNLLLHTLNALLVAWVIYLLSREKLVALFVGLLFAVHPLHTEAVVWAAARKDLLSTFFFLLSVLAYLSYRRSHQPSAACPAKPEGRSRVSHRLPRSYFLSLLFFLLGLLAKVMVITLPILLLLIDFKERRKWERAMILDKLPYVALSVVFGIVALYGKRDVTAAVTLGEIALMAGKSTVFYLAKLFAPIHLSVFYPYTGAITLSSPDFFLPLLVLFVFLVFSLWWTREIFFGSVFFLIALLPTFMNFPKGGDYYFASDRYVYLPSIGILYLVCSLLLRGTRRREFPIFPTGTFGNFQFSISNSPFSVRAPVLAVVALAFAFMAHRQSLVWADTETLFRNVLVSYPTDHRAHNNLGNIHRRRGEYDEAVAEFEEALNVRPHPQTLSNLGAVLRKQGKIEEAFKAYERAIALAPNDPEPYFGRGIVYAGEGRFEEAMASYDRALELDPTYADVWSNIGALAMQRGERARAIEAYRRGITIDPFHLQSHYNLAVALAEEEKSDEAMAEYRETIHLEHTFLPAHINLALLLYKRGDLEGAKGEFEEILKIDPGNAGARTALEQLENLSPSPNP